MTANFVFFVSSLVNLQKLMKEISKMRRFESQGKILDIVRTAIEWVSPANSISARSGSDLEVWKSWRSFLSWPARSLPVHRCIHSFGETVHHFCWRFLIEPFPNLPDTSPLSWKHAILQAVKVFSMYRRKKLSSQKTPEDTGRKVMFPNAMP